MAKRIGQTGLKDTTLGVPQRSDITHQLAVTLGIMRGDKYGADIPTIMRREMQGMPGTMMQRAPQPKLPEAPKMETIGGEGAPTDQPPADGSGVATTRFGLPWQMPAGTSSWGQRVLNQAHTYLGIPYVYGGTNPQKGLDCSGFVQRVFQDMGIALPRVTYDQVKAGTAVDQRSNLRAGDLLFFWGDRGNRRNGHVAIYMGGDLMVDAPYTGANVGVRRIPWQRMTAMRRVGGFQPESSRRITI